MNTVKLSPETKQKMRPGEMGVSGITTMAGTVVVWALGESDIKMPPEVAVAAVGIVSFVFGKIMRFIERRFN